MSTAPDNDLAVPAHIRAGYAFMRMQQHALQAHEASLRQYEAAMYAAIQVTLRPGMAAILASPRAVLRLTHEFKQFLGVTSAAAIAWYARQGDKTYRKHWPRANDCFRVIADGKTRLTHVGTARAAEGIFQVVLRGRDYTLVFIPILFVPAGHKGTTEDQCRVLSVYQTDKTKIRSHVRRGLLVRVIRSRYRLGDLRPP